MVRDEKSVVLLQGVCISCGHTPKADTQKFQLGGSSICKKKKKFKKTPKLSSVPQLYSFFAGLSESNQDSVSVEMTQSLG